MATLYQTHHSTFKALGDQYLRDVRDLRAGQDWDKALLDLIDQADVFQLFWSTNAMCSRFVRREWEYALTLKRPYFIRPTYWEDPMPESSEPPLPPEDLRRLHFHRIGIYGDDRTVQLELASDSDVTAAAPVNSGINLGRPSESEINLGRFEGLNLDPADSIELAPLDDDSDEQAAAMVGKGEKDIFEDTDFEVDALGSEEADDRTMQLEAASDFDIDESDSASEVFAMDEEDVDENVSAAMAPAMLEEDEDEFETDAGGARGGWDVDSEPAATGSAGSQGTVIPNESSGASEPSARFKLIAILVTVLVMGIFMFIFYRLLQGGGAESFL